MKKIFFILSLSLLFSQNSFSVSMEMEELIFTGCYQDASKKNADKDAKNYCNCYSSYISDRYTDEKLNIAMSKPDVYEVVVKPAAFFCYNKFPLK